VVSQIALIDKAVDVAQGHALDLTHGMQFTKSTKIIAGDSFELVKGAQIVVLSAGISQKVGQTRADLLEANVSIFKNIIPQIVKHNKNSLLALLARGFDLLREIAEALMEKVRDRIAHRPLGQRQHPQTHRECGGGGTNC